MMLFHLFEQQGFKSSQVTGAFGIGSRIDLVRSGLIACQSDNLRILLFEKQFSRILREVE